MSKIRCLFLDFDNTLVSYSDAERKALFAMYQYYGLQSDFDDFANKYKVKDKELWEDFEDGKIGIPEIVVQRFDYMRELYPSLNASSTKLNHEYLDYFVESTRIEKEFMDKLKELKGRGILLIIVTNGIHDIQERRFENIGIANIIDDYVTSEEAGAPKPAAAIFDLAMAKAQKIDESITVDDVLMVGDNYKADVMGAREYGIPALWVDEKLKEDAMDEGSSDAKISSFVELTDFLDKF